MARHLRVEFPGAIYHVNCRMLGDSRARLFGDTSEYERFIERLAERVDSYDVRLYLYCLMRTHFHLVLETPKGNLSQFMQSLNTAYTVYYNLRHDRHGHLLDGRYKAKLVEGGEYLLALSRYIHLNPVRIQALQRKPLQERVQRLRTYSWSSYPGYMREAQAAEFVEYGPLLSQMSGKKSQWRRRYRSYVETGLAENDDEFQAALNASPRSIGGEDFRAKVDDLHFSMAKQKFRPEDIALRNVQTAISPDVVMQVVADGFEVLPSEFKKKRRASPLRAVVSRCLIKYSGLSQREVAETLNMTTGAAVSVQLRNLPKLLEEDRSLRRVYAGITKCLDRTQKKEQSR